MGGPDKELQEKIDRLHRQADRDPALAQAFSSDPKGTLETHRIETENLTFATPDEAEVAGYLYRNGDPDEHDGCFCMWHEKDGTCSLWFCL